MKTVLARSWFLRGLAVFGWVLVSAVGVFAQQSDETHLALDGWIEGDGSAVHLTWNDATSAHRGTVEVSRRIHGSEGAQTWLPVEVIDQAGLRVTDTSTQAGLAYEYRVLRRNMDGTINDVGFWLSGRDIPVQMDRGIVHLVVDQTQSGAIQAHLARFIRDLVGDGWHVRTYTMPRHDRHSAQDNLGAIGGIKNDLVAAYEADPISRHAVILVGHVPFAQSGRAAPDGHTPIPHATDLIYGDVDGRWHLTPDGTLGNSALPSDSIEMQVGRIDFAQVTDGDRAFEAQLLRAYFDKNHNWRHGRLGDLREAYGGGGGLIGEIYGLRNIVGPMNITEGGHHDVGEAQPWLWGVDFGDHAGHVYAERYANRAVFAINFGSHKQRIEAHNNAMVALLAQPWYTLAVGWGSRPAWWPHHMALGGSIGDVHMRTVNNGIAADPYPDAMEYFPTGQYVWRNPVWVNLLGDPTLRAFVLAPPSRVEVVAGSGGNEINWQASPDGDVIGYHVFRLGEDGTFIQISGPDPVEGFSFMDADAGADSAYMVRAFGQKDVHAGSFQTLSQGVFGQIGLAEIDAPDLEIDMTQGAPVQITPPQGALIFGFIEGPEQGDLTLENSVWTYTPAHDFSGQTSLRYVVSDQTGSAQGLLNIIVRD